MGHTPTADRIAQRCRHVSLAAHVVEALRPPLARENLVAQPETRDSAASAWRSAAPGLRRAGIAGRPRSQPNSRYRCFLPDLTEFTRFVIERDPAIAAHRKANCDSTPRLPAGQTPRAAPRRRCAARREREPRRAHARPAQALGDTRSAGRISGADAPARNRWSARSIGTSPHSRWRAAGVQVAEDQPAGRGAATETSTTRGRRRRSRRAHRRPGSGRARRSRRRRPASRAGTSARGSKPGAQALRAPAPSRTRARGTTRRAAAPPRARDRSSPPPSRRKLLPSGVGGCALMRAPLLARARREARARQVEQTPLMSPTSR